MLISISQAAEILGVSRSTAYRLAKLGRLPCVRSFGPVRIHRQMLLDQIAAEAESSTDLEPSGPGESMAVRRAKTEPYRTSRQLEQEMERLLSLKPSRTK